MPMPDEKSAPLLPAAEESPYHAIRDERSSRWPTVCAALFLGIAVGGGLGYYAFRSAQQEVAPAFVFHEDRLLPAYLASRPAPCASWEARCRMGADMAKNQGLEAFWPAAQCAEAATIEMAGKVSCANRAAAWAGASIAQSPSRAAGAGTENAVDSLQHETLFLFLPGTGTSPAAVRDLLDAAADMGCHVLALSYASLPIAVSQTNIWCTRPGADPALCNVEMHEAVLFGAPTTASGGGHLWDVPANQSVSYLLEASLRELGWVSFLNGTAGGGSPSALRWDRIVVAGHSQGASHAAYLSTILPLRAAVLFSGPQEVPACSRGWLRRTPATPMLRRAVYALREECGDEPALNQSYCGRFPYLLRRNLDAMGMTRGYLGAHSGYVVVDFEPLVADGRSHHNSIALSNAAPPPTTALWKALLGRLDVRPEVSSIQ
jgi:hypothetical protein